jgi:hypothetical protein
MFNLLGIIILPSSSSCNCHNCIESGNKTLLALYLALNAICITIYLIRIFYWFFKNEIKNNNTFFDYVFFEIDVMSFLFLIINSLAFIVLITLFIGNFFLNFLN